MSPKYKDDRQITLDFERQLDDHLDSLRAIAEHTHTVSRLPVTEGVESEAELYVTIAGACKTAIDESGMSRAQVLDGINAMFGRKALGVEPGAKKPKSMAMFNNYLSKPQETPMPVWILYGICAVTGSFGPLKPIGAGCSAKIISTGDEIDMIMGKLEQHIREGAALKKELQKEWRRK